MPLITPDEFKKNHKSIQPRQHTGLIAPAEFKAKQAESQPAEPKPVPLNPLDIEHSPLQQKVDAFFKTHQMEPPPKKENVVKRSLARIFQDNPVARVINYPFAKLGSLGVADKPMIGYREDGTYGALPGTNAREDYLRRNPIQSTGSKTLDEVLGKGAELGSYFFNPSNPAQGPLSLYKSPAVQQLAARLGGKVADKLPNAGLALSKDGTRIVDSLANKAVQEGAKELVAGSAYAVPYSLIQGQTSPKELAENVVLQGGLGAAAGLTGPLVGAAAKGVLKRIRKPQIEPKATPPMPKERIVQSMDRVDDSERFADNFKRGEEIQKQYQQALEDEYSYLKQSLDNRGGVTQGNVIRDATGEVTGRFGRISNNPKWYQDFFAEHGRKPTDKELRELAKQRVNEGFRSESGQVPSFKPSDLQEIDSELASIQRSLQGADNETRTALTSVKSTLEKERGRLAKQLPEGVVALEKKPLREVSPLAQKEFTNPYPRFESFAGNQIPFTKPEGVANGTISRTHVIRNLKKNLGVTIDTGRLGTKRKSVLGIYKIEPKVVRSRMAEDIQAIAHEVGHHLDHTYNLQLAGFDNELKNLLRQTGVVDISRYPAEALHGEGIAEYFRLRMTEPAKAQKLAPGFTAYLDKALPTTVKTGLTKTEQDVRTWLAQDAFDQAKGLIDFTSGEKNTFSWSKLYTRAVDDLNPLKLAEKALKGAVGFGKDSLYKMARLSRGTAERAKMAVTRGIYDESGQKISEGLQEIVRPVIEAGIDEKDFITYVVMKHAKDLKELKKNTPFTPEQMDSVINWGDNNPIIQKAQQDVVNYNNALMDLLVEGQIVDSVSATAMRQKYPNYVPFLRFFEDDAEAGFKNGGYGASRGFANITSPLKRMSEEGSFRTIINPVESMVKNTFLVMNSVAKNKVGLNLAELAKIEGAGAIVEHVPGGSSSHEHVVNVWIGGEKQAFKIRDPELYNAMLSLDHESANEVVKFLGGVASVLRAGATLTPEFTIRNSLRDIQNAIVVVGLNPVDWMRGLFHVVRKTEQFDQFISSGGAMSTLMSLDRNANREAMQEVFKRSLKDKALNVVTSPKELAKFLSGYTPTKTVISGLRKAAEVSELSTKMGTFQKTLKKTGSLEEAAFTARDLMDFNRAGSATRSANRMIAFLNSSIQGTDRLRRSFMEKPLQTSGRAFTALMLPAILVHYWNKNLSPEMQKEYANIPQWQKDTFYVIGIPETGVFLRIPKPFEAGVLFATGTERVLQWMEGSPRAFDDYGRSVASSLTPPVLMTAFTPLLEVISNHSFFLNRDLVPLGEQRYEKKDQYGLYTSETAKTLAQALSHTPFRESNFASPRAIDNLIYGYTAGLGQYGVAGLDKLIEGVKGKKEVPLPAKKFSEQPFVRSFTATTSGGGQIREDFYNAWDRISKKKASADKNNEPFLDPLYSKLKPAKSAIDKLYKDYKFIQKSDLPPQEKRKRLDDLDEQMNDIAARALGREP